MANAFDASRTSFAALDGVRRLAEEASRTARLADSVLASASIAAAIDAARATSMPLLPDLRVSIDAIGAAGMVEAQTASLTRSLDAAQPLIEAVWNSANYAATLEPIRHMPDLGYLPDLAARFDVIWRRWRERMLELAPDKQRLVRYLADRGWHQNLSMPWWDSELMALIDAGDPVAVDAYVADVVEATLDDLVQDVATRFPARLTTVERARAAHVRGEYDLAILGALSQADGITYEVLGVSAFGRQNQKPRTAPHAQKRIAAAVGTSDIAWELIDLEPLPVGSTLLIKTTERDAAVEADPAFAALNRHGVLHGLDVNYGTRENSLRAFAALGYFLGLRELLDLPRPPAPALTTAGAES